jgi:hypothetical protein
MPQSNRGTDPRQAAFPSKDYARGASLGSQGRRKPFAALPNELVEDQGLTSTGVRVAAAMSLDHGLDASQARS